LSSYGWKPLTHRLAMAVAPLRFRRNVRSMHEELIAAGLAHWLFPPDQTLPVEKQTAELTDRGRRADFDPEQDLRGSVAALQALLDESAGN
jgi:hypothetical protein